MRAGCREDAELMCIAGVAGRGCHASTIALILWGTPPSTTPGHSAED
jgi:hypothetical protein